MQDDIFWGELTIREHLWVLSMIKGISKKDINPFIDDLIVRLNLQEAENNQAKYLSGGNQRKLSLANSITLGNQIFFFDAISTGLDPFSKKCYYNIVNQLADIKKASIVVSSHSMSEVSEICNRLGIL